MADLRHDADGAAIDLDVRDVPCRAPSQSREGADKATEPGRIAGARALPRFHRSVGHACATIPSSADRSGADVATPMTAAW